MSFALAGAIATALAVTCLILAPLGSLRVLGSSMTHPESDLLDDAGWTRSALAWEGFRAIVLCCGLMVAASLGLFSAGLVSAALPSIGVRVLAARRRDERARQTVGLLQMTLAGLRSGASLTEALRHAVNARQELAPGPFADAMKAFDLGAPLDGTLRAARTQARDRRVVLGLDALSLCVAEQLPASRCAVLISSAVDRLVFEQRLAEDVRARTSGLRVQILLLAALVPGLALYLSLTLPGMGETLATPLGRFVLLPLAAALETVGIIASRRVASDIT